MKRLIKTVMAAMLCTTLAQTAAAHTEYPNKPVTIVVPFGPGGTDTIARLVGQVMSEELGQPVIVNNRPGASGTLGSAYVAKRSEPDGYTLLLGSPGSVTASSSLFPNLAYSHKDLVPIGQIVSVPNFLVTNKSLTLKTTDDLVKLTKERKDPISYATSGVGTSQHLAAELFSHTVGIEMLHVPYKGSAAALTDIVGGVLDIAFVDPTAVPMIRSDMVNLVGITTPNRSKALPDLPTLAEVGATGYSAGNWYGLFAPKGTDPKIIDRLNKALHVALSNKEVQEKIFGMGMDPVLSSPNEFAEFLEEDVARWKNIIEVANIRPE